MSDYAALAKEARREVLGMVHRAKTSHIASNFSVIDMATVLYANLKPEDRVVWSKGWAAATIYYFLAKKGVIPYEDLNKFPNEPYLGLAEPSIKGVEVSGGAMGHGLPVAVGEAIGKKRAGEVGTIYCIISDGELNEGTTWESAALAAHHKLDNLVVLIDVNKWQAMGKTEDVVDFDNPPIEEKFESFGFIAERIDGHNHQALESHISYFGNDKVAVGVSLSDFSVRMANPKNGEPIVLICDTIKGKGVSFMENHLLYHYKQLEDEEYKKAMEELA